MQNDRDLVRQVLKNRGYIRIPSRGISMLPSIRPGDICCFIAFDHPAAAKAGDILLYVSGNGELVGHRLLRKVGKGSETLLICKGDFNRHADAPLAPGQVLGKMIVSGYKMKLMGLLMVKFPWVSIGIRKLYRKERTDGRTGDLERRISGDSYLR